MRKILFALLAVSMFVCGFVASAHASTYSRSPSGSSLTLGDNPIVFTTTGYTAGVGTQSVDVVVTDSSSGTFYSSCHLSSVGTITDTFEVTLPLGSYDTVDLVTYLDTSCTTSLASVTLETGSPSFVLADLTCPALSDDYCALWIFNTWTTSRVVFLFLSTIGLLALTIRLMRESGQ